MPKKKYNDNISWICIGIDSYGHVQGHASYLHDDETLSHTAKEKSGGTTSRWCIRSKMFMNDFIPQPRHMTNEELCKVQDWLVKHGWAKDDDFTTL